MNDLAIQYLTMSEPGITGFTYLVLCAGGVIGAQIVRPAGRLRRVPYFLSFALITAAYSFAQLIWLTTPVALAEETIGLLVLAELTIAAFIGCMLWIISASRSRDIDGKMHNAFLAFIPFANLWLMLKAGDPLRNGAAAENAHKRSGFKRWVMDPLGVFLALIIMAIGRIPTQMIENGTLTPLSPAQTESSAIDAYSVQSQARIISISMRGELPARLDNETRLDRITASGATVTYSYTILGSRTSMPEGFDVYLDGSACGPDSLYFLANGGTAAYRYHKEDGSLMFSHDVTLSDC